MRRKDREVSSFEVMIEIVKKCDVCRLGLSINNQPYVVPLNYGYEVVDGTLVLYFHGASVGKKIDIIQQNPAVCFEVDCDHQLIKSEKVSDFSFGYSSVIGTGNIEILTDLDEVKYALKQIVYHYTGILSDDMKEVPVNRLTILKLRVTEMTGKQSH